MPFMCPYCGLQFPRKFNNLVPPHAEVGAAESRRCPGSEQAARNSESDRRPLWRDDPGLHGRTATVKPNDEPEPERAKGAIVKRPELLAMNDVMDAIDGLPLTTRRRIVGYVATVLEEEYAASLPRKAEGCE